MRQYGPMKNCSTLRQERLHQYFKNVARSAKNYINFPHTATHKYQVFQAWCAEQDRIHNDVTSLTLANVENEKLNFLADLNILNAGIADKIIFRGIKYSSDLIITISRDNADLYRCLFINFIVVDTDNLNITPENSIFFLGKEIFVQETCYSLLQIVKETGKNILVKFSNVLDYYPLKVNLINSKNEKFIVKHHEFYKNLDKFNCSISLKIV